MSTKKKRSLYYGGVRQAYPELEPGMNSMSRSVIYGNIIFLSSLDGRSFSSGKIESGGIDGQMETCLDNIKSSLEDAGSSMDNLVKLFIMVRDYQDCPRIWKTMFEYYRKNASSLMEAPPAVTITQVDALTVPEALVAVDSLGVISQDTKGWETKKTPMITNGVKQIYPNVEPGMPLLSESVVIGNLIFISGMAGNNTVTGKVETNIFEEQWRIGLDKVRSAMDNAGSSMSNIIKTLHFQTRLDNLLEKGEDESKSHSPASDRLWMTELEYFDKFAPYLMDEPPGSTFLKVSSLSDPGLKGQTEVVGVLSRYMPGWEVKKYPTYLGSRGFPRHMGEIKKYYANTVKVGNLVFVSGQTPTDSYTARIESDVFEVQMTVALDNLRMALEETGSALENIIKTNILLPDPKNLPKMREMELEYYKKYAPPLVEEPPASTVIHPLNLASPAMHIEIEAIAFV
ncbi:MAG: hypothetical protein JRJ65_04680 [Deltaproteobacteria bacterium]|nr:hypothetical protein [Deltaproteobacteria bacterium]